MGLTFVSERILGYELSFYRFQEMYQKYIEIFKASKVSKKIPGIYDYLELIISNTGWDYTYQHSDEGYGYYCECPRILIYNTEPTYLFTDYFSIDGKKPVKTFKNKKWEEFIYNKKTKSYNYVLNSNERAYGFNAPEIIDLADLGFKIPKLDVEEHNKLKENLKKLCIDLDKFKYSDYIISFYV